MTDTDLDALVHRITFDDQLADLARGEERP
jgi:hypothetical protein